MLTCVDNIPRLVYTLVPLEQSSNSSCQEITLQSNNEELVSQQLAQTMVDTLMLLLEIAFATHWNLGIRSQH